MKKFKIKNDFESVKKLSFSFICFVFFQYKIYNDGRKYKRMVILSYENDRKILKFNETDFENLEHFIFKKNILNRAFSKWIKG